MTTLYGIKNCDTIKKARKWLAQNGIDYRFHDYREDGLKPELLKSFLARSDWQTLLNQRSAIGGSSTRRKKPIRAKTRLWL